MANRWGMPKEIEELVRKRDLNCVYCRISFESTVYNHKTRPTWEHIINDIRINGADNIALCCVSCNASKGTKRLEDWMNSKYCSIKNITIESVAQVVKDYLDNKIKRKQ